MTFSGFNPSSVSVVGCKQVNERFTSIHKNINSSNYFSDGSLVGALSDLGGVNGVGLHFRNVLID